MSFGRVVVLPLSRFLISAVFIAGAIKNVFSWEETQRGLIDILSEWQSYFCFSQDMQSFFAFLISWSSLFLMFTTGIALLGGVFVLLGYQEKLGISLLALFLIPTTVLYHPFWWVEGPLYEVESAMFLKNLAILGCLIKLLFQGSLKRTVSFAHNSF